MRQSNSNRRRAEYGYLPKAQHVSSSSASQRRGGGGGGGGGGAGGENPEIVVNGRSNDSSDSGGSGGQRINSPHGFEETTTGALGNAHNPNRGEMPGPRRKGSYDPVSSLSLSLCK